MATLGILGFSSGFVSRATHPDRTWIDGWNLNPARDDIRGVGDLDGDGRADAIITSDWGIGILRHDGSGFRCPFAAPRDTMFGNWRYDATDRPGRDRVMAIEDFTGSARQEVLVWSSAGMATLVRNAIGFLPTRHHPNGTRLGGWVLSTVDNIYCGSGRFGGDRRRSMVLKSPWGIGIVSLQEGTSLAMTATGSRIGSWLFRTDQDRVRLITDLDGDGQDELLMEGPGGIAVLKVVAGRLEAVAVHNNGDNLSGLVVGRRTTTLSRAATVAVRPARSSSATLAGCTSSGSSAGGSKDARSWPTGPAWTDGSSTLGSTTRSSPPGTCPRTARPTS